MENAHLLITAMAFSQVLLLAVYHFAFQRTSNGVLFGLACLGVALYLAQPVNEVLNSKGLDLVFDFVTPLVPSLFWLHFHRYLSDEGTPPLFWFVVASLAVAVIYPILIDTGVHLPGASYEIVFNVTIYALNLGICSHLIFIAWAGLSDDLVLQRLRFRIPLAIGVGFAAAFVILVWEVIDWGVDAGADVAGSLFAFVAATGINLYVFRSKDSSEMLIAHKPVAPDFTREIEQIRAAMEEQRLYAKHGATIGALATHIDEPEYKVRKVINQQLGYTNFNQLLNEYRIEEASRRLLDEPDLPIKTIAIDAGYKSISSFNKSFREKMDQTPSEYRGKGEKL